jgi:hypothetical protein
MRPLAIATLVAPLVGCGYGLHQTAKTQAPGAVSLVQGFSYITNSTFAAQNLSGATGLLQLGMDVGPLRAGLSDHVDMGIGFLYGPGVLVDSKFNVLRRSGRLALAPRLGSGFAVNGDRTTVMWMAGLIASYDVLPTLTPYLAGTFANHWIKSPQPDATFAPGEHLAPPTGAGDGLLELTAGVQWRTGPIFAISAEYGLWLPVQNDPGTFYSFVTSQIFSIGLRFCFHPRCD